MELKKYISSASNLFVDNKLLKFVVGALFFLQLWNYIAMKELREQEKVIIVPIGLYEQVEVSSKTADISYLNAMATYIATLLYSTTPTSAEAQSKLLLTLFDSKAYKTQSEDFLTAAYNESKNQVTKTMRILSIVTQSEPKQQITVELTYDKYIFKDLIESDKRVKLVIDYKIEHGNFKVTSVEANKQ